MVQVDLITGFLGAGKTTFLRRYVRYLVQQGHKVCILENDFGAVNVDAMLVQEVLGPGCDVETISGGCDCDTHQRRMRTKLIAMAMRGFDRVVVEPSGIFDVDEFFDILRDDPLDRWYQLGSVIAVVDALLPETLSPQAEYLLASETMNAGCVLLSRAQLAASAQCAAAAAHLERALETAKSSRRFALGEILAKDWDALTDAQKELVEGDEASPDYFGLDTGDASLDDARNQDEIGENELLVVSFGTSYNDSRVADIKGIEDALQAAYPDWSVRRAFTAQIIINHIQARDGEKIDNMTQALDRAVANGVKNLVVQPTHLMHGAEYDEMCEAIEQYKDKFESVSIAEPLLGEVGSDATVINADKEAVAKAITAAAVADAGFESLDAAKDAGTAFVFMGHGTAHVAKVTYSQMQTQMQNLGYENVFIGTVEGEPEETACEAVIKAVKAAGYTNVVLRPLMVVAGDHANNDMAGSEEDSWKTMFEAAGFTVNCQIHGLGEIADVQALYVAHTKAAIDSLNA